MKRGGFQVCKYTNRLLLTTSSRHSALNEAQPKSLPRHLEHQLLVTFVLDQQILRTPSMLVYQSFLMNFLRMQFSPLMASEVTLRSYIALHFLHDGVDSSL